MCFRYGQKPDVILKLIDKHKVIDKFPPKNTKFTEKFHMSQFSLKD